MNRKNYNIITYLGCIICMTIIVFNSESKLLDVICGIAIGMNIMLIIDVFCKRLKMGKKG